MAPYERDARRWLEMPWFNRYSGREYGLRDEPFAGYVVPGVRPKRYRDVLWEYRANPEAKSLDPGGGPCLPETRGLLARRAVSLGTVTHAGKESNRLEGVEAGLVEEVG